MAPVIIQGGAERELKLMRWGLIPAWTANDNATKSLINARAESLMEKPSFRQAFQQRRCLIPADGFYEWKATAEGKIPHRFTLWDGTQFCFAGLWDTWTPKPDPQGDLFSTGVMDKPAAIETFSIITIKANALVEPLHDRMPVILPLHHYERWLATQSSPADLQDLLAPFPAEQMLCQRVSRRLNSPRVEGPECLEAD